MSPADSNNPAPAPGQSGKQASSEPRRQAPPHPFVPSQDAVEVVPGLYEMPQPQAGASKFAPGNSAGPPPLPPPVMPFFPKLPDKPVTPAQAREIFDKMAAMKDIAFGFPADGCYARAHLMCVRMLEDGHTPGKAWAFESEKGRLTVTAPSGDKTRWWYHVAPSLPVQMPDGSVQNMVIDPSLFDGPTSMRSWGQVMNAKQEKVLHTPLGAAPGLPHNGDYTPVNKTTAETTASAVKTMEEYVPQQPVGPPGVFHADMDRQVAIAQHMAGLTPLQREMLDLQPARRYELQNGISGISAEYKFPAGMSAAEFDRTYHFNFTGEQPAVPKIFGDIGVAAPQRLPSETAPAALERSAPEVKALYRHAWENLVDLNPALKRIKVDKGSAAELYHATNGVAAGFNPDDINFFLKRARSGEARAAYFLSQPFTKIETDFGARPDWIASPETLGRINLKLTEVSPMAAIPGFSYSRFNGVGGAGASAVGFGLGVMGLHDAIRSGDVFGQGVATANIATSTLQGAEGVAAAVGKTLPGLAKAGKFVPGLNAAITVVDGAYQISKEDTAEHKVERGTVVAATAATGVVLGTAAASTAEAGAITAAVTGVLGTGAAGAGAAAVAVAAAPVVLTTAAVVAVGYTGQKALEAKRAWDDVDRMIADNGAAKKRQGYRSNDGKPSVLGYGHIAVALLHHSEDMKNENLNGTSALARDQRGRFKIQDFRKIDMRDPKNIAELERVLDANIKKQDEIIKANSNVLDRVLPKWMAHGADTLDKITMAQMERADLAGARQELELYKKELKDWDAQHPGDLATTGVKPAPAQPPAAQKPKTPAR